MRKFLATISYDGSIFHGWAKQIDKFTIQGYIEKKINNFFKKKIIIYSSGRTDKFVHAKKQIIMFSLPDELSIPTNNLFLVLKKLFYDDYVFFKELKIVDENTNLMKIIQEKEYEYIINIGSYNLFERRYSWQYCKQISPFDLNKILKEFKGIHDFFAFSYYRSKDKYKINTKKEIFEFKSYYLDEKKEKIIIKVNSKGFLRYQVRKMIGEAIACYEKKQCIEDIIKKLNNAEKIKKSFIAPPFGLYLSNVLFIN